MIGPRYWSTGISLKYHEPYGSHGIAWSGQIEYFDDGFADDLPAEQRISTQGVLRTRYAVEGGQALAVVIDVLMLDAERLGVDFKMRNLYWNGEGPEHDQPPAGPLRKLVAQCKRIGWQPGFLVPESDASVSA